MANNRHRIRIGTRRSQLAMWQACHVRDRLLAIHPGLDIEIVEIVSEGDKTLDIPLSSVGGKGLFLKELEMALLNGDTDIAVHSMKDVTVTLPEGLVIPVICPREDPRMHLFPIAIKTSRICLQAVWLAVVACAVAVRYRQLSPSGST